MATIKGEITTLKNKDNEVKFPRTVSSAVYHNGVALDEELTSIRELVGIMDGTISIDFDKYQNKTDESLVSETNEDGSLVQYVKDLDNKIDLNKPTISLSQIGPSNFVVPTGEIIVSAHELNVDEGDSTSFTVRLSEPPTYSQKVTISVNDPELCRLTTNEVIFTSENYNVEQTINVMSIQNTLSYESDVIILKLSTTIVDDQYITVNVSNTDMKMVETLEAEAMEFEVAVNESKDIRLIFNPQPCIETFTVQLITPPGSGTDTVEVTSDKSMITVKGIRYNTTNPDTWNTSSIIITSIANPELSITLSVTVTPEVIVEDDNENNEEGDEVTNG